MAVYNGALGPTGPTPLLATGSTGQALTQGAHLRVTTGTAWLGGSSGLCSPTGQGFPLGAAQSATGAAMFLPVASLRQLHVYVAPNSEIRWLAT
jgi:hypothetical protein